MRTVYFSYTIYLINEKNSNFVGGDWSQFPSGGKISSTLAKERTRRLGMVYNYYFFTQRFTQYAFISKRNIKAKFQMCTLPNTKCCSVSFKKVMEARNCSFFSQTTQISMSQIMSAFSTSTVVPYFAQRVSQLT